MTLKTVAVVGSFFVGALILSGFAVEAGETPTEGVAKYSNTAKNHAIAVFAGELNTAMLLDDGTVRAQGWNDSGQLGDGTTGMCRQPIAVRDARGGVLGGVQTLVMGGRHTAALLADGTVQTWGANNYGQLGNGDRVERLTPGPVIGPAGQGVLSNVVALTAGEAHTVALLSNGTVMTWGHGRSGQLGLADQSSAQTVPAPVQKADGQGRFSDITAVAAGRHYTVALKKDGTVWSWGANTRGQLGDGTMQSRSTPVPVVASDGSGMLQNIRAVVASPQRSSFTAALGNDGTVWTWGENASGQLGDGDASRSRSVPGQVVGPDGQGVLTRIVAVAISGTHAVALRNDGTFWAWGNNQFGQLGDGTTINRPTPVRVALPAESFKSLAAGARHTAIVRANGSVVAWGNDWYGQLGKQAIVIPTKQQPPSQCADGYVIWTTASQLMPQWGFYPNGSAYGGIKPIGSSAAWTLGANTITWVPELPVDGPYHIWARKVYGGVKITVDEQPPTGAKGGPGGGAFAWQHYGVRKLNAGSHHVDIAVQGQCMFDAVLLTTSDRFNPNADVLPDPVVQPVSRAPRRYRDDSSLRSVAGDKPFVAGRMQAYDNGHLYDWLPAESDLLRGSLRLWGAPNQFISGSMGIRAVKPMPDLTVSLLKLIGPGEKTILQDKIDVRVVHVRERPQVLFSWQATKRLATELLLKDDRTTLPPRGSQGRFGGGVCRLAIPRGESRQIWLTIQVPPDYPPGVYSGEIILKTDGATFRQPIDLDLLPLNLKVVEGYYSIYYPVRPAADPSKPGVSEHRYRAELQDMVRHGLNTVSLYGGFDTLHFARNAGMTQAPCIMGWPGGHDYLKQVEAAKAMGFADLLYYGVDEPNTPEQIERCRKEAVRRRKIGFKMLTAISVPREAWEGLKDVVEYPVLINHVYGGKDGSEPAYAREQGHCPVSYWMTSCTFPMLFRSYTGLYNTACGFQGTMPWSYTDFSDPMRKYDPDGASHQVTYPDEDGLPIPTLQWEAYREGIDDVRYLQALDRAIADGRERLAQSEVPPAGLDTTVAYALDVRKKYFESIFDTWFRYLIRVQPSDLDMARRAFADATIGIEACLRQ